MKKILILGGMGFLGSKLYEYLSQINEFEVKRGTVRKIKSKDRNTIYLDILQRRLIRNQCKPFDIIINCTGQITTPFTECLNLNTIGIDNIIFALKGTNKTLIQMSTVAVYGTCLKASEESPLNPETPYAVCKAFSEYLLKRELKTKQLTIFRLSNLYGDVQQKGGVMSYLFRSCKSNKELHFDNNGELSRYYLNVNDCASIISKFILKNSFGGIYNLIGPEQFKIKKLVSMAQNSQKVNFKVKYAKSNPVGNINEISDKKIRRRIKVNYNFSVKQFFQDYFK